MSPREISLLISEDIRTNNGLLLEGQLKTQLPFMPEISIDIETASETDRILKSVQFNHYDKPEAQLKDILKMKLKPIYQQIIRAMYGDMSRYDKWLDMCVHDILRISDLNLRDPSILNRWKPSLTPPRKPPDIDRKLAKRGNLGRLRAIFGL